MPRIRSIRVIKITTAIRKILIDYDRFRDQTTYHIYNKVGDPFLAEDLTSTVFLKALRWLKEDQSMESARGWLYATARTSIAEANVGNGGLSTFICDQCVERFHLLLAQS